MRIVGRQEFMSLPPGTVYSKCGPSYESGLCIKDENRGEFDFWHVDLAMPASGKVMCRLDDGEVCAVDLESFHGDEEHDPEQRYLVWSHADVAELVKKLTKGAR